MTTTTRTPPIFIRTPQPDTEERLVVVPLAAVLDPSPHNTVESGKLVVNTSQGRDATPDDLARAGWVPLAAFVGPLDLLTPPTLDGVLEAIHSVREAVATECDRQHDEAMARAEKAERELAEVREAAFDADSGPGEAPTAFEAVTGLRLRVERAERERNDVLRDPCARGRSWEAMRSDRDRLLTVALDAERELVEARAELARLTAPVEEPRIVPGSADHLEAWSAIAAFVESGGGTSSSVATQKAVVRIEGAFRSFVALGVAHERARSAVALRRLGGKPGESVEGFVSRLLSGGGFVQWGDGTRAHTQPEKDRATDEELVAVARTAYDAPQEAGFPWLDRMALAVAAHVRKERCLERQIRKLSQDGYATIIGAVDGGTGCADVTIRGPANFHAHARTDIGASDLHATLARLLGEVSR